MASAEELLEAIRDQGERGIALISELQRTSLVTTCSFESRRGGVPKVVLTEGIL